MRQRTIRCHCDRKPGLHSRAGRARQALGGRHNGDLGGADGSRSARRAAQSSGRARGPAGERIQLAAASAPPRRLMKTSGRPARGRPTGRANNAKLRAPTMDIRQRPRRTLREPQMDPVSSCQAGALLARSLSSGARNIVGRIGDRDRVRSLERLDRPAPREGRAKRIRRADRYGGSQLKIPHRCRQASGRALTLRSALVMFGSRWKRW